MRYWTWASDAPGTRRRGGGRVGVWLGSLVVILSPFVGAAPALSQWLATPEVRLSGGSESDLVLDPTVTRTVVPGGAFLELSPALSARRWVGRASLVDLGAFGTFQQFFNDDGRRLLALTGWTDLYATWASRLRGRFSASFDTFDDSERSTVRRLGAGAEAGLAYAPRRFSLEIWGGGRGRRYPQLTVTDLQGVPGTYDEATWSAGTSLRAQLGALVLRAESSVQRTEARGTAYDAEAWNVGAGADLALISRLTLTATVSWQERRFTARVTDDRDEFGQVGLGLRYRVAPDWIIAARGGFSTYTWPDGSEEDTHRLAITLQRSWGRRDAPPPPRIDPVPEPGTPEGTLRRVDPQGTVVFRVTAPEARSVQVVGDFSAWEATPMHRGEDEIWEVRLPLDPGLYEYAYVIDGVWTTPPEATLTVDDGFGGRNGLLEVVGTGPEPAP